MLTREEITAASIQFGETTNGTATEKMAHNIGATWANEQNAAEIARLEEENEMLKANNIHLQAKITLLEVKVLELKNDVSFLETEFSKLERDSE